MILFYAWYFVIFSFLGWLGSGIMSLLYSKKFVNKGFLASPFCPIYGFLGTLCCFALKDLSDKPLLLYLSSALLLSLAIVAFGFAQEKIFGFKPWDFSEQRLRFGSYITLPYILLLGVVGLSLVGYVAPFIKSLLALIPIRASAAVVSGICLWILLDAVFSFITAIRLRNRIKSLGDKITEAFGDGVSPETLREFEENYNKIFSESILRRRLANFFPEFKASSYAKFISDKVDSIKKENMLEYTTVYEKKDEKPFAFGICFTKLFYLFLIGSFLGTLFETVWALVTLGHFEIRVGMVIGPFIPVYGGGAVFLTVALYKLYKLNDTLIFLISAAVGAVCEYICSWLQEALFGTVSWDYSDTAFNVDGRTNLMFALIWGFLGLVWVRFLYPWISKLIEKLPKKIGSTVTTFLIVFMLFDSVISCAAVYRWQQRDDDVEPGNSFSAYIDRTFDDDYMTLLFPHMKDASETGVTVTGRISSKNPEPITDSDKAD